MDQIYTENIFEDNYKSQKQLSVDDFHLLTIIGRGSYAKVALVRKKNDGKIYALKVLKKKYIK